MNVPGKLFSSLFPLKVLSFGDNLASCQQAFTHLQCSHNFHLTESLEDKLTCCHQHSQIFEQLDVLLTC